MRLALSMLLILLLAGCGGAAAVSPGATTSTPGGSSLPAGSVEAKAAQMLAQQAGVDANTLQLTAKEPQEWPNGGLGCPDPNLMYTEAIVPGFKLTFTQKVPDGTKTYEVHTDESGDNAVLCENGKPASLPGGVTVPGE